MGFLKELDFTNEEILIAENSVPDLVINEINASKDLVIYNINYFLRSIFAISSYDAPTGIWKSPLCIKLA